MRELQLVLSDDLHYMRTGDRIPAEETVTIALDGRTRELDLTAENAKRLRELISPYIDAGHAPGQQSPTAEEKTRDSDLMQSRARQKELRDWADSHGLRSDDGERPIYRTPGGGYYYPYKLRRLYQKHLEDTGG